MVHLLVVVSLSLLFCIVHAQRRGGDSQWSQGQSSCGAEFTYDYVVVGAGSAGAIIAKELSDDGITRVLLIEAGAYRDNDPNVRNPALAFRVAGESFYNFDYYSAKLPDLGNRRIETPVGRMWGGCSSHNYMQYVIGNAYDYDNWAQYGGEEWSSANVMPIYREMENNSMEFADEIENFYLYHGTSGRVNVRNAKPDGLEFYEKYFSAVHHVLGLEENSDINGETQEGFITINQYTQQSLANNEVIRESSSTAYLSKDIVRVTSLGDGVGVNRRQLWVHSNSYATTLVYNAGKVVGIKYLKNGQEITARAINDVIISAGALNTPAILMRSGIGNCTELAGLGINCVVNNNAVGNYLQDHPVLPIYGQISGSVSNFILGAYKSNCAHLFTDQTISGGNVIVDSFLQLIRGSAWIQKQMSFGWDFTKSTFTLLSALLRPKCKGRIYLSTSDPLAPPIIEYGYLCHPDDFNWASNALDDLLHIIEQLSVLDSSVSLVYPTEEMLTAENRNQTIMNLVNTMYHNSGSVRMGEVLDGNLCVKGISGLRVADASIMPMVTSSNTNAPSMMIGRKAADLIKATIQCS